MSGCSERNLSMRKAVLLGALLLAIAGSLDAQTASGQITGVVKDPSGAIVPDAKITLANQQTGITRDVKTNATGAYTFPLLPVGVYSVTAEQQGFRTAKRSDIQLNVDQIVR